MDTLGQPKLLCKIDYVNLVMCVYCHGSATKLKTGIVVGRKLRTAENVECVTTDK